MVQPNSDFTDIIVTTLRNRSGELADNVTQNNAFLSYLKDKNKIKLIDGGRTIVEEIDFVENGNFKYYTGYETLDIAPQETFTAAEYNWKQAAAPFTISGLEQIQNAGTEKVIDLVMGRRTNSQRTMANGINEGLFSDGTGFSGKEIGGLDLIVADDPTTGVVGGIDRAIATNTFWRNQRYRATTDGGAAADATNIQSYMNSLWLLTTRGMDTPQLILAGQNFFTYYESSLQAIQRFSSADEGRLGFQALKYKKADVVFEATDAMETDKMYFLNLDFLTFKTHKDRNFVPLEQRMAVNQDATTLPIVWAGNLTASNCALQGVLNDL